MSLTAAPLVIPTAKDRACPATLYRRDERRAARASHLHAGPS
jgi:hypothetical protein